MAPSTPLCPSPVWAMMVAALLLQRLAVPGSGGIVGVGLVVGLVGFVWALLAGRLTLDPIRIGLYCLALCGLAASFTGSVRSASSASLLLLLVVYLPFVAVLALRSEDWLQVLAAFRSIATSVASLGLLQFAVQFVLGSEAMFPLDAVLPTHWFVQGFNLKIPIWNGAPYLKSTGFVFLEPSHFAQTLALAIIVEVLYFAHFGRLLLYGAAYLVSFSGTGLVLLLAVAVPIMARSRALALLAASAVVVVSLAMLMGLPGLGIFLDRLAEFEHPLSSGYMRFIGPYRFVADTVLTDPLRLVVGFGAGSFDALARTADYGVLDTIWAKLLVEYGLIGLLSFAPFYFYVLFAGAPDRLLSAAFLIQVTFLGGYLNSYYVQYLALALAGWPRLVHEPRFNKRNRGGDDRSKSGERG